MVSKKVSKPMVRERPSRPVTRPVTSVTATSRRRVRPHSLAPEHIGEAGSAAILAIAILGLAAFIAAVAMIASGLATGGRYGSDPPPNVGELGTGQVLGGVGLLVLGGALVGSALAVLADVRGSRLVAAVVAGLAAILSAAGVLLVTSQPTSNTVLAAALAAATLIFAVAAIVLGRPRR